MSFVIGLLLGAFIICVWAFNDVRLWFTSEREIKIKDEYKLGKKMLKKWLKEERRNNKKINDKRIKEYEDLLWKDVIWVL